MKSAYELAMEKLGDEKFQQLSDEQKNEIAEIERKYQSKIAEAEVMSQDKIKKALGEPNLVEQIRNDLVVEIASFREKSEQNKELIRTRKANK